MDNARREGGGMTWKSYSDLAHDTTMLCASLPDFDIVAGVPRSGMIPASIVSQVLNKPLTSVDVLFNHNETFYSGRRIETPIQGKRVLVIDDSYNSGYALRKVQEHDFMDYDITYAVVYGVKKMPKEIIVGEVIDKPRVFEWNVFSHNRGKAHRVACDIDGVLCPNKIIDELQFPEDYEAWILTAPQLHRPTFKLKLVVTNRLEQYRRITEQWLENAGIQYEFLVMAPYQTPHQRKVAKRWAADKIVAIEKHKCNLMIESSKRQAEKISRVVPTICTDNMRMYR